MKLEHAFRRTYIWGLLLTALIALVVFVVHIRAADAQLDTARRINLSLTVRTHMHSVAFLANQLVMATQDVEREAIRREIRENIDALSTTYASLLSEAQSPALEAIHLNEPYQLSQNISAFVAEANLLTNVEIVTVSSDAYKQVIALRPALLNGINFLAAQYQHESDALVTQTRFSEMALLALMLFTLGLEAVFIFRPMERRILTTQRDLQAESERSRAAASALKNSETRYREMFENNPAVKLLVDPQTGRIVEANRAASTFYGYSLDALTHMTVMDINAQPSAVIIAARDKILAQPHAVMQGQHRLSSGETRSVEVSAGPLTVNGKPHIYAIVQDVSKRIESETALHESEVRYRALFEQTSDGIFILDLTGKLLAMNQSAIDMLGYAPGEIDQFPIVQLSAQSQESLHILERLAAGERVPIYERLFRRKNGQVFPVEINAALVLNNDGTPLHIQSIVRDISQRKQAEQALGKSEQLYRTLVQNMPSMAVMLFDTSMRYTLVEGPFVTRFPNWVDAVGKLPHEIMDEDVVEFAIAINERALRGETFSYERLTPEYDYQAHVTPLRDETGAITGGMILMHDITDLSKTQDALRENEQRLRLITDNIQDVITQTDADNVITFASPSYLTMLGYDTASVVGRKGQFLVYRDDLMLYSRSLREALTSTDHRLVIEGRLVHKDGHILWTETIGTMLFDAQGQHIGAVYVTREITERKRLEQALIEQEKLRTALEKEQELSTLKTQIMEVIAHEFRTPLAVIQLSIGTLTDYYDRITTEQRATKFTTITERIRRITEMLNALDIIVRGGFTTNMVRVRLVDFAALCRTTAAEYEQENDLRGRYDLGAIAPAVLYADDMILRTAVRHILSNAARFSEPSTVVKVSLAERDNGFDLSVTDNGIGIPQDEQVRLFQPFFRGSNVGAVGGLGLGLTIARTAIEAHRGTISVESAVGQGTTVRIWMPLGKLM